MKFFSCKTQISHRLIKTSLKRGKVNELRKPENKKKSHVATDVGSYKIFLFKFNSTVEY